jgi:hypothetical protein
MKDSILNKLLNIGLPIIKPGSIVQLAKTNEEVYIRNAFIYPDNSVVYTGYIFKSEKQRQELNAIYPSEIKGYSNIVSMSVNLAEPAPAVIKDEFNVAEALQDIYTEILATRTAVYNGGTLYCLDSRLENFNSAAEAYENLLIKFELRTASNYGYINDKLLLPNDSYIVVYFRNSPKDVFIPVDYITRKVTLKPFIKRMFTTLLYGRSHRSNFSMIEDNRLFTSRLLEIITNQQKERGYIQYNRSEVMI